jgi:hypothetical protein
VDAHEQKSPISGETLAASFKVFISPLQLEVYMHLEQSLIFRKLTGLKQFRKAVDLFYKIEDATFP